jgi:hypothetical protein
VTKSRHRRDEPPPEPGQVAVRGVLSQEGLAVDDLAAAAGLNHDLYGFYGISVWVADDEHSLDWLERTKLAKFSHYAAFAVADLAISGVELWATGQSPHYDVVHDQLETLVERLRLTAHQIRTNPHLDREER